MMLPLRVSIPAYNTGPPCYRQEVCNKQNKIFVDDQVYWDLFAEGKWEKTNKSWDHSAALQRRKQTWNDTTIDVVRWWKDFKETLTENWVAIISICQICEGKPLMMRMWRPVSEDTPLPNIVRLAEKIKTFSGSELLIKRMWKRSQHKHNRHHHILVESSPGGLELVSTGWLWKHCISRWHQGEEASYS